MKKTYSKDEVSSIAKEVLAIAKAEQDKAVVIGLCGALGAGKTTLVQAIALELGVKEVITSPTFVIAKWYKTGSKQFSTLVHVDAYRIEKEEELETLGFRKTLEGTNTLIIIEWPEKILNTLEDFSHQLFNLHHKESLREIEGPFQHENTK